MVSKVPGGLGVHARVRVGRARGRAGNTEGRLPRRAGAAITFVGHSTTLNMLNSMKVVEIGREGVEIMGNEGRSFSGCGGWVESARGRPDDEEAALGRMVNNNSALSTIEKSIRHCDK